MGESRAKLMRNLMCLSPYIPNLSRRSQLLLASQKPPVTHANPQLHSVEGSPTTKCQSQSPNPYPQTSTPTGRNSTRPNPRAPPTQPPLRSPPQCPPSSRSSPTYTSPCQRRAGPRRRRTYRRHRRLWRTCRGRARGRGAESFMCIRLVGGGSMRG